MARSLRRITPEGTRQERSQTRIVLALEVCTTAPHGDVDRTPMKSWSDSSLQVDDLKAAAALLSSAMTGATYTLSHTIMLALPCMHHAPSD